MEQTFDTGFQLNEGTVLDDVDNFTADNAVFRIFGNDVIPGVAGLLFETEGDALFVFVNADDDNFELIADVENFGR